MKKISKLSKILLLIATVFSYIASPISVLAEEVIESSQKPLVLTFEQVTNEGEVSYLLTYKSEVEGNYENEKNYKIELDTTVTYGNKSSETLSHEEISVSGTILNTDGDSHAISNPVNENYNGEYVLDVTVYDGETEVYSEELKYVTNYSALTGLAGKLYDGNGELVSPVKDSNYDVTEGKYAQKLNVLTGDLSPNGLYRIAGNEDVMTGEVLRNTVIDGTEIDLTGKLAGKYSYTESVTIEEVTGNETDGYTVVNTYPYTLEVTLNYGSSSDNDNMFSELYGVTFKDGYMVVSAKEMNEVEGVITVEDLLEKLDSNTVLGVTDKDGNEVSTGEVKNDYVVSFTNGVTASYKVIVKGDADLDNDFDSDDLTSTMEGYLEKDNMPSMDMVTKENDKLGTITIEDVIYTNELLKGEDADFTEKEIGNATVVLGKLPEKVYVGDSFEVDVLVSSENTFELIDALEGTLSVSGLKLDEITYGGATLGVINDDNKLVVVASDSLSNGMTVLTIKVTATEAGEGTINFNGNVYRYMDGNEFKLNGTVKVESKISSNSYLSSLNASVGKFDIKFDKKETVYTLTVPYDTEKVILSGALEDIGSSVDGLIEYELKKNKTTAIITVTAVDGTKTVYTVYIVKEKAPKPVYKPVVYNYSSNNYLESLEVEGYEIDFDKKINEYKITVKNSVTSLDIKAIAEHSKSRVKITGNGDFKEGENTVVITVTAEDGSTREYKLLVTREVKKQAVTNTKDSSNTGEKIVIIILIILVVLGLLYLIFKKDDEDRETKKVVRKEDNKNNSKPSDNNKNIKNNNNKRKK